MIDEFIKAIEWVKSGIRRNGLSPKIVPIKDIAVSIEVFNDMYNRYCTYLDNYENLPLTIRVLGKKDTPTLVDKLNTPELSIYPVLQSILTSKYCYVCQTEIKFHYQNNDLFEFIQRINREYDMNITIKPYDFDPLVIRDAHNKNNCVLYNYDTKNIDEWVVDENVWGFSEKISENGLNIILNDAIVGEIKIPIGLFRNSVKGKIYVFEGV